MYHIRSLLVFLIYFVLESKAFNIASIITPCKIDDHACLMSSTQSAVKALSAGISELGVPSLDPVVLDLMQCDEHELKITVNNTKSIGFGDTKVVDVERKPDSFKLVIETPIFLTGQYDAQGKILFIPVIGNGDFEFKTDNMRFNIVVRYKYVERHGKRYWKITGFDYTFFLVEKCYLKFDNLFNGDETLSSIITPCKMEDHACIMSSTQNAIKPIAAGIPELGVPSFDPVSLKTMHCDEQGLKITLDKGNAIGFSNAKVIDIDRNSESFTLVAETPFFLSGTYDAQGNILFVPVTGNGDFQFKTDRIKLTVKARYKNVERDGKKYWKVTGFDYTYELIDKVHLKFDNLFNGDETLAKPVHDILDNNWKEVITQFGGCFIEKVLTQLVDNISNFFESTPTDTLEIV